MRGRLPPSTRRLPRPLEIPSIMTLHTLAHVRTLIGHLPAERRNAWPETARKAAPTQPSKKGMKGHVRERSPGHLGYRH
jgi:hypothetical protein